VLGQLRVPDQLVDGLAGNQLAGQGRSPVGSRNPIPSVSKARSKTNLSS
jgi:hypothetical protein